MSLLTIAGILFVAAIFLLIFWITSFPGERPWAAVCAVLCIVAALLSFIEAAARNQAEHAAKDAAEEAAWVAKGCPVYKTQCLQGKAKHGNYYPCERKAAVVGRNQVGDIFVEAYPICKKANK